MIKYRRLGWAGYVAIMQESRTAFKISTGRRYLGGPRRRREGNMRMDLKKTSINTRNWVDSDQGKY